MRVTNKMLSNNFLRDMNVNLNNMRTMQGQLTSGKEIRRPSDNPFKVSRVMQLYSDIDANNQYNENIMDMKNWLDTTDTAMGQANEVVQRIRQLMVSAGNAGYSSAERGAIKDEINERIGEFSQILNTTFEGKYIFGGTRGTTKPVDVTKNATTKNTELHYYGKNEVIDPNDLYKDGEIPTEKVYEDEIKKLEDEIKKCEDAFNNDKTDDNKKLWEKSKADKEKYINKRQNTIEYNQIKSKISAEISQGVILDYNVSASNIIKFSEDASTLDKPNNIIDLFANIVAHLDGKVYKTTGTPPNTTTALESDPSASTKALTGDDLATLDKAFANLLKVRSEVGAKTNRLESAEEVNIEQKFNMTEILSKNEDIDITEKTMEYANMQTVYIASLQTSAKVLQPSLMDYLR